MKIISLKALNINSLIGKTELNFSTLTKQSSLFAITGPTGSGKSTLLDIISCALYGRTSRLKNPNDLMSKHSAEAYCEVEFEIKGKKYRSSWTQKRAYKKHDGAFQSAKMELVDLDSDKVLALKSKEVPKKIEELSGLDFGRFTQSMMLAQGSFDAFLKADEKERSELLEKITGTQIYAQVSMAIFEKHRILKQELESDAKVLESIELLDKEIVKEKEKTLEQNIIQKSKTDAELKELTRLINWTQILLELKLESKKHEEEFIKASKQKEQNKSSFLKLSLANKALNVSLTYSSYAQFKENLLTDKTNLTKLIKELEALDVEIQSKTKQHSVLKKELDVQSVEFSKQKQKLKLAFELFLQEKQTNQSIINLQAVFKNKQETLNQIAKTLSDFSQIYKELQSQIDSKMTYLKNNAKDEKLNSTLELIKQTITQYKEEIKTLQESRDSLKLFESKHLSEDEKHLLIKESINKLLATLKELELEFIELDNNSTKANIQDINHHINTLRDKKLDYEKEVKKLTKRLDEIEQNRTKKDELLKEMNKSRKLLQVEEKSYYALSEQIQKQISQKEQLSLAVKSNESKAKKYLDSLKSHFKEFGVELDEVYIDKEYQELLEKKERYTKTLQELKTLQTQLTKHELDKKESQTKEATLTIDIKTDQESLKELELKLKELMAKRLKILSVVDLQAYEKDITTKFEQLQTKTQLSKEALNELLTKQKERFTYKNELELKTKKNKDKLSQVASQLEELYKKNDFKNEQEFKDAMLNAEQREELATLCKNIQDRFMLSQSAKTHSAKKLQEHLKTPSSKTSKDELESLQALLEQKTNALQESIGSLKKELEVNQENSDKHKTKLASLEIKKDSFKVWVKLNELVGSADGTKFKKFAQGITLEQLINLANQHLNTLSSRYTLSRNKEKLLDLEVIDAYQGNISRPVSTLSGGESFIVSLALALGLSELASQKIAIDSLFLDEGFGTLDEESLETALNALNLLQSGGKMVGVISHVEALKERIPLQIKVKPRGDGTSFVEIE